MDEQTPKYTCLKLEIKSGETSKPEPIFVKGTWHRNRFHLGVTDGLNAWTCDATEEEVNERASYWDQKASDYIEMAEKYLGFQQPGSVYRFADAGDGSKRLSWTFEKEGTKLEWRWKCHPSSDSKKRTCEVLDFLMDANIKLSEEVVWKTESFERLQLEAEKCLEQSTRLSHEKADFDSEIYGKFVRVLNSKKAKLRELRDRLAKEEPAGEPSSEEEGGSTERTESFGHESNEEVVGERAASGSSSKVVSTSRNKPRGRKRK